MSRRARGLLPGIAVVVLFCLPLLPEILGARLLVFRDAQITHWPWHRVATESLRRGEVPFINASASGGQPLLANPNAVLLYPTFLLETVVPAAAAFNLHYLIHVLWAFFGARRLARRLGMDDGPSFVAAVAYAFSGMMLSYGSAFMNSAAAAAWLPWCGVAFLALARARRVRAVLAACAATGLALGLQLLAGEPALSLLTLLFGTALLVAEALALPAAHRARRLCIGACGSVGAGMIGLALAAPLLLPLRAVFPLTYRGQHLYSERAFGAAAFSAARAIEWLLPRFGGDPDLLGGGANWLRSVAQEDFVYIWCVTFGVVPLALILLGAVGKGFWGRKSGALAAGGLVTLALAFGFSLPLYRALYAIAFLRRLRYPIKFYLLTTVSAAMLAGLGARALGRRRTGRREAMALSALFAAFLCAWWLAAPGGALDRWAGPIAARASDDPREFLAAFRGFVRGDALLGCALVLAVAIALRPGGRLRDPSWVLGLLALLSALVWGLPLFVSAPSRDLLRPPALLQRIRGPGRLYVSETLPRFDMAALRAEAGGGLPRTSRVARILVEELVAATGAPFGVRYLFENDPDGSYGYFNRLTSEAAAASAPRERDRLLTLYGARWVLADGGEEHPLFRPVTGFEVAGRRLMLYENKEPVAELRWAGRVWARAALSGTLTLVRSDDFDAQRDVAIPGRPDRDPAGTFVGATLSGESVGADHGAATVDAEGSGYLVFSRTYFPAWRARLDGERVPVVVANARDLGVAVPAGRHRVELDYDRTPFRLGVALQAAAVLFAVATAAAARRPRAAA